MTQSDVPDRITSADDALLRRFRAALDDLYGDRLQRVVLFGSRARGDAREDSDYDVAVFLATLPDYWREQFRLATLKLHFIDEAGVVFDAKAFPADAHAKRTPIMHEIRKDGRDL